MKLEIEFPGSEISEVRVSKAEIEIHFSRVVIIVNSQEKKSTKEKELTVPAMIRIGAPKYSKLPKKGVVDDGELYGIPGKALNGRLPVDFSSERTCELSLSLDEGEYSISGKSFLLHVDLSKLPDIYRH